MEKKTSKFNAEHHDEDTYIIEKRGISINMMMDSGIVRRFYLTHEAIKELHEVSMNAQGAHVPTPEEPWS